MPDYIFLLESRLTPEQRAAMLRVQELAAAMGFNVYLTGGTVRDLITGATLRDMDFTVEGNPSKMARELEKGGAKILSEDEKLVTSIFFFPATSKALSAPRETTTTFVLALAPKSAGPPSWRISAVAISLSTPLPSR